MAAAPILMAVGAAASAYGSYRSGMSQASAAESEATASRYNAALADDEAAAAGLATVQNESIQRRKGRAVLGEARAALATSGLSSQTAADVMGESATAAEFDALNVRYEGMMRRRAKLSEAAMARWQAVQYKKQAKEAKIGAYLGLFGGAASSAGSIYGQTAKTKAGG